MRLDFLVRMGTRTQILDKAETRLEVQARFLAETLNGYLSKPFDLRRLKIVLAKSARGRHAFKPGAAAPPSEPPAPE